MANKSKSKIRFKEMSETCIAVLHSGKIVGQIYSDKGQEHGTPFPHDEEIPTLESIQICGFTEASKIWACGVFHGTKDIVLRFNPMTDKFYEGYHSEYKRYVDSCFKNNKPQAIKSFDDWVTHMGYPKEIKNAKKD